MHCYQVHRPCLEAVSLRFPARQVKQDTAPRKELQISTDEHNWHRLRNLTRFTEWPHSRIACCWYRGCCCMVYPPGGGLIIWPREDCRRRHHTRSTRATVTMPNSIRIPPSIMPPEFLLRRAAGQHKQVIKIHVYVGMYVRYIQTVCIMHMNVWLVQVGNYISNIAVGINLFWIFLRIGTI